ncbi:MAG: hypothetical protein ABFR97_02710 [Thermodesulfobacteriota bacterium]
MMLGEALVDAAIISTDQLKRAIVAQKRYPGHSLGQIVVKLYDVPVEIVETLFVKKVLVPALIRWLERELARLPGPGGENLTELIRRVEIGLAAFSRHEGEAVIFSRDEEGYFRQVERDARLERIKARVDSFVIHTTLGQQLCLEDEGFAMILGKNKIKPDNPGFVPTVRLLLIQAMKESRQQSSGAG